MPEYNDLRDVPIEAVGRVPCNHKSKCPCWEVCVPRSRRIDQAECGTFRRWQVAVSNLRNTFRMRYLQFAEDAKARKAAREKPKQD